MSSIVEAIKRTHKWADDNNWPTVYWSIDLHGTVFKPNYDRNAHNEFYPHARDCLRYLSEDDNNVLIMSSSSWPDDLQEHAARFFDQAIYFKYINENPEVETGVGSHGYFYDKFYFNVMLEDKAGFDPETDWKDILDYMRGRNG